MQASARPDHFYHISVNPRATGGRKQNLAVESSASGEKKEEASLKRRRESLQLRRLENAPSVLPAALWKCLNANTMSIGQDLRPGKRFR